MVSKRKQGKKRTYTNFAPMTLQMHLCKQMNIVLIEMEDGVDVNSTQITRPVIESLRAVRNNVRTQFGSENNTYLVVSNSHGLKGLVVIGRLSDEVFEIGDIKVMSGEFNVIVGIVSIVVVSMLMIL
jgi:hypothetical protein